MFNNLFRRKTHAPVEKTLGSQSPLVLAKLGYDLREAYDDVVQEPLPEAIQQVLKRLPDAPSLRTIQGPIPVSHNPEPTDQRLDAVLLPSEKPIV
jgi:hypothetical protein